MKIENKNYEKSLLKTNKQKSMTPHPKKNENKQKKNEKKHTKRMKNNEKQKQWVLKQDVYFEL